VRWQSEESSLFGYIAYHGSVVRSRPAIEDAFCSAVLVTLVGSLRRPLWYRRIRLRHQNLHLFSRSFTCSATTEPSRPRFSTICLNGFLKGPPYDLIPICSSPLISFFSRADVPSEQRDSATRNYTFSTAGSGRVQLESSTRAFFLHLCFPSRADIDDGEHHPLI